uniref:Charged multivesicular body protein 7 n=1 Tax=Ditylenchus dipsaci TaxID=166011 RepID=A0A915CW07_9BILA
MSSSYSSKLNGNWKPYFPDVWENDDIMQGLMSLLKPRRVYPTNYDRIIDFWKNLIAEYCKHEQTCLFSLDELKQKFRRGSQLPSPLSTVIKEMQSSGIVQTKEEYSKSNQGWIEWGASFLQPTSWLNFGSTVASSDNLQIVHLPTLKVQADQLLRFYQEEYEGNDSLEVVDYAELKMRASHIIQPESFTVVVEELVRIGEISVGFSKDGDKVLKFKDQSSQGPARFTECDASAHDLKKTMTRIENDIKRCEAKATKFDEDAEWLKKKRVEKDITDKDVQYQRLLAMVEQLAQSKQTKEIIDIYKAGSKAFKDTLARQGLTPENVDVTMDSMHEIMSEYNDVEEALRDGFRNLPTHSDSVDETELEAELNEILAENGKTQEKALQPNQVRIGKRVLDLGDLPDVPTSSLSGLTDSSAKESLEARWKRLRTAVTE